MMYELVLKGFDGSTDKTDDKIIWIKIPENTEIILNNSINNPIKHVLKLHYIPCDSQHGNEIDLCIENKRR